jgi:ethanolamine utilization protein
MAKNKITLNVLADITRKIGGGSVSNSKDKALIVFNGSNIQLDKRVQEVKSLQDHGINVSLAFSFMAERILDTDNLINSLNPLEIYREEDIFNLEDIARDYSYVIGPNITMNTLSKISQGFIDSFIPNILWTYLYMGKKVYLDFTSVKNYLGKPCQNKEINNIIENHINGLKKMGVIEIEEGNYIDKILNVNKAPVEKENIKVDDNFKKVITERDINNFSPNMKSIILPKGSIITPLAKDRARELGIKIEIEI